MHQPCKINNSLNQWKRVLVGVREVSILRPLLFNIFINGVFLFLQKYESANYADDYTMISSDKNINNITISFNHDFAIFSNRFCNFMTFITVWSSILINFTLCYLALGMDLKQISYLTRLLSK